MENHWQAKMEYIRRLMEYHISKIGGTSQCGCGNLGCSECYASGWKLVELKEEYYPDVDMNDLFVKKSNDTVLKNFVDNIARAWHAQ